MSLLANAILIAVNAHEGQVDKAGAAYIEHPLRVAIAVEKAGGTEAQIATALLHDVVEDSEYTTERLLEEGIPQEVVEAVAALTKEEGERYEEAVERAARNPISRLVKYCDIEDNSNPDRLALLDEETQARLKAKYKRGKDVLEQY